MGVTVSILLIAAGAIMRWAVTATADGFNIHTIGMILFLVGIGGLVVSMIFWSSWGGMRRRTVVERETTIPIVERDSIR